MGKWHLKRKERGNNHGFKVKREKWKVRGRDIEWSARERKIFDRGIG